MQKKRIFVVLSILVLSFLTSRETHSQSPGADGHKFEIGGQVSVLSNSVVETVDGRVLPCINPPCPVVFSTFPKSRKHQPGFGGRFGYNLTDDLALEAELNLFPRADLFSQPDAFNDGNLIEGLFGVKAGKRFEKVGIFAKARPGFLYASTGDLESKPDTACVAIFPPPAGCFQTTSKTSFAFDLGGLVELYPTKRTLIRLDVGDRIIRLDKRNVSTVLNLLPSSFPLSRLVVIDVPAETTHNLQVSAGIGFRF